MNEKWVCNKCSVEILKKPLRNQTCGCKGRYKRFVLCKCNKWFTSKSGTECPKCKYLILS
jgi:hypothetical protein